MFTGRDDGPLAGAADLIPATSKPLSEDAVLEYAAALDKSDLPIVATMGVSDWTRFIKRMALRKLVRELPPRNVRMAWFVCHVPPAGTATLQLDKSTTAERGISLKVFGSGFGRGRKVTQTASTKLTPQAKCLEHRLDLKVLPRIYVASGEEFVETEVLEYLGEAPVPRNDCAVCREVSGKANPVKFKAGPYIDLRNQAAAVTQSTSLEVKGSTKVDAGFEYPGLPVKLELSATVEETTKLAVETSLPHGYVYTPFSRLSARGPIETAAWARTK